MSISSKKIEKVDQFTAKSDQENDKVRLSMMSFGILNE